MNALIETLKTVSLIEWGFWAIVIIPGIKGFIEYPNIIKNNNKNNDIKEVTKETCIN